MTSDTCWTSMPRASRSVVISTRLEPERNSRIITSRWPCSMSPCCKQTYTQCDSTGAAKVPCFLRFGSVNYIVCWYQPDNFTVFKITFERLEINVPGSYGYFTMSRLTIASHSSSPRLSLFPLLSSTLPGPSTSEVMALQHCINLIISSPALHEAHARVIFADVLFFFKEIFCSDFCQTNYLNIYRTDLHEICRECWP